MSVLERLRGGLIVSVQAPAGSALDDPAAILALSKAAIEGGAVGLRIRGASHLRAIRAALDVPVIGLVKRVYDGFEPYITPTLLEVREVLEAGADIVAFDATARPRPDGVTLAQIVAEIRAAGRIAMADCAVAADGVRALSLGAHVVASTLCGYTTQTKETPLPALALVRELAELDAFVICEGGIAAPHGCREALDAGADAVVVGTALTGIAQRVGEFAGFVDKRYHR